MVLKRIALAIFAGMALALTCQALRQPVGLERLFSPDDSCAGDDACNGTIICNDSVWTNQNADGARLRFDWATYEPVQGQYLWNTNPGGCVGTPPAATCSGNALDCAIGMAYASGKHIGISFSGGVNSPEWIYNSPIPKVYKFMLDPADNSAPGQDHMPIIWDTVYQGLVNTFLTNLQTHVNTLPGISSVWYWVTGFTAKQVDMSTWVQNIDKSTTVTDAVLTNSTTYCQVTSNTAHFLTTSNPNNTQGFNGIGGRVIGDCLVGECTPHFRPNSIVCQKTFPAPAPGYDPGCPADPTDTTVYVNKNALTQGADSNKVVIEEWLIGLGEFSQLDGIAKTAPPGYPGLTSDPDGMTDANCNVGNGGCGKYVPAAEAVVGFWASKFPNTVNILTRSAPYPTTQGQTDSSHINNFLTATYGNIYGAMTVARGASCPPHVNFPAWQTGPGGAQAIYPTGHSGIYQGACNFVGPSTLQDLFEAFLDHSNKFWEVYPLDVASTDFATGDPTLAKMAYYERCRVRFGNLQVEDRALISLR